MLTIMAQPFVPRRNLSASYATELQEKINPV